MISARTPVIEGMFAGTGLFICSNYDDWVQHAPDNVNKCFYDGTHVFYLYEGLAMGFTVSRIPVGEFGSTIGKNP